MRIIDFLFFLSIGYNCFAQSSLQRRDSYWQIHLFTGTSYGSPDINLRRGYPINAYRSITEPRQGSYGLGLLIKQPLGRFLEMEFGFSWQRFQVRISYDPVDSLSNWGVILDDKKIFDFVQVGSSLRKDYYIHKKVFVSGGLGLFIDFTASASQSFLETVNPTNRQYQTFQFDIKNETPTINLNYNAFVGLGIKVLNGKEVSFRVSVQKLFLNSFDSDKRYLNAKGFSLVYAF